MKRFLLTAACVATLSASASYAQSPAAASGGDYPVLSGGVGLDERQSMESAARDYNLKLAFAAPSGEYFDDVQVAIASAGGKKVYEGASDGPWFFIKLPPGRYTVAATMNGKTIHRSVRVPNASKIHFYFPTG